MGRGHRGLIQYLYVIFFTFLQVLFPAVAVADNPHGYPHYGAYSDTATCGACHNSHAAEGINLLTNLASGTANSIYRNCTYCHRQGGQSRYDVVNGAVIGASNTYASAAGGFQQGVTQEGATPQYAPVTSRHNVDAAEGTRVWVPGYSQNIADYQEISCASCHNPHGSCVGCHEMSLGKRHRLLRNKVNGVTVTVPSLNLQNWGVDEAVGYTSGINAFCGACHQDFHRTEAGSGDTPLGTFTQKMRHRVGMNPAGYPGINPSAWSTTPVNQPSTILPLQSDGIVLCTTCHYAHGTLRSSTVTYARDNGETTASSALLRQDNRGVCQACHNK